MRIIIFNVAAQSGGALTILKEFYNSIKSDKRNEYIFILSKPYLEETDNIKIISFPWVKKSWIHRIIFDYFYAYKLVNYFEVDKVISLQNLLIPNINLEQTIYIQQSLQFCKYKFNLLKNPILWIYQNVIGKRIISSIKKADKIIVQSKWMKEECQKYINQNIAIEVIPPKITAEITNKFNLENYDNTFIYPANSAVYKNHLTIIEAAIKISEEGINNYRIIFTFNKDDNQYTKRIYKKIEEHNLNIDLVGYMDISQIYQYYSSCILIFSSYIETFGLPLLEAKLHQTPIIASNCKFSREILDNYERTFYFEPLNVDELVNQIKINIK